MNSLRRFFYRIARELRSWLRAVTQRDRLEAEMEAELAEHLESLIADLVRAGHSPPDARRRARIALGSPVANPAANKRTTFPVRCDHAKRIHSCD